MTLTRTRTLTMAIMSAVVLAVSLPAAAQGAGRGKGEGLSIPVSTKPGSPVTGTGTFLLQRFVADGATVKAVGIVTGTFTNGTDTVSIARTVSLPVKAGAPAPAAADAEEAVESGPSDGRNAVAMQLGCPILHLDLGPLDLNLLGLDIELSQIILDIVAEPGAGNLLGNLLCAVVGLLDGPATALAGLLNQILAALLG